MNQHVSIAPGSLEELPSFLESFSASRIFLVTGKGSFKSSGSAKRLEPILTGYTVQRFHDFETNPMIEDVHRGVALFSQFNPDTVIAIGGGSVIDMGKIVNLWASNGVNAGKFFEGTEKGAVKGRPLIAIPTTAGSGSEATRFATLYTGRTKRSVEHEGLLPDSVILDPTLTESLPPGTTAASGMDALSHSMESYWSIRSTEESKQYACRAIDLILPNLAAATHSPDLDSRAAMLEGAHFAGKAINIARTTAAHAISYPLTSCFKVPHGQAVALSLTSILDFNAGVTDNNVQDARGSKYVRGMLRELSVLLGAKNVAGANKMISGLITKVGLETKLGRLGLREEDIGLITGGGFDPVRAGNNPRLLTEDDVRELLKNLL